MENAVQFFEHERFGRIRVVMIDGEPWFVAADVCRVLELGNVSQALTRLDKDELTSFKMMSGGQRREMKLVNEPGLYRLIFSSRKEKAREFQRWIYHEVLPSIRKTGSYSIVNENTTAVVETAPQKESEMARVYVLSLINKKCQCVKIGHSKKIRSRVAEIKNEIKSDNEDDKFFVNNMYFTPLMPRETARSVEWATQEIFSSRCVEGEFFSADFDKVCDGVKYFVTLAYITLPESFDFEQVKTINFEQVKKNLAIAD